MQIQIKFSFLISKKFAVQTTGRGLLCKAFRIFLQGFKHGYKNIYWVKERGLKPMQSHYMQIQIKFSFLISKKFAVQTTGRGLLCKAFRIFLQGFMHGNKKYLFE